MPLTAVAAPDYYQPDFFRAAVSRRVLLIIARDLRRLASFRAILTPAGEDEWGVTADDTHAIAVRHGYATGAESNTRALSWYAAIPKLARLYNSGRRRAGRNRNTHTVYVIHRP